MNADKIIKIIKLGRLHFVFGGFLFFCLGALFALLMGANFNLGQFIFGYFVLFAAHISLNYSNDYYDLESDKYGKPTQFAGGSGILVNNPELKVYAKWIGINALFTSLILSIIFIYVYSVSAYFFLLIIFANFLAWFYTAPPIRMSYNGFGEVATILSGFVMPAIGYFALMGNLDIYFFIFSIPIMLYQMLFINAVEIPDLEGDINGGKKSWITSYGRAFGFKMILISGVLGTLSFFIISIISVYPESLNFKLISLASIIPLSFAIWSYLKKSEDRTYATNLINKNLISLFIFAIIVNSYFIYLIL
ncbi:prenyltransferase [Methanobacterium sp. ACI-7]|uniref:prenyltransferase n=1 Tax=unclassified Methanobacterium TaxID=2627676 RepID=UPI0039C431C3